MIKCHIFSLAVPAREYMWHFIMFCESIFHMSLKQKISNEYMDMKACAMWFRKLFMVLNMYLFMYLIIVYSNMPHDYFTTHKEVKEV
jgi:hypothetical protein